MARVTASRTFASPPNTVRDEIRHDPGSFVDAGGFDSVEVLDDRMRMQRSLGFATLELIVRIDEQADAVLAFDAVDGIFERMRTEYHVEVDDGGSRVTATTDFTLGGVFGTVLDATLVSKQRKREFEEQFDYLERELGS